MCVYMHIHIRIHIPDVHTMSDRGSLFSQRSPWLRCTWCYPGSPVTVSAFEIPILSCSLLPCLCLFVRLSVYMSKRQFCFVFLSKNARPLVCVVCFHQNTIPVWCSPLFSPVSVRTQNTHTHSPALTRAQANRERPITHSLHPNRTLTNDFDLRVESAPQEPDQLYSPPATEWVHTLSSLRKQLELFPFMRICEWRRCVSISAIRDMQFVYILDWWNCSFLVHISAYFFKTFLLFFIH